MSHLLTLAPIRNDAAGSGFYKASRSGGRVHKGVDYYVAPGSMVLAPETGDVGRYGYPYSDDTDYRIVDFHGRSGRKYRFFYAVQVGPKEGDQVLKGDPLCMAQNVTKKYPNAPDMCPHVHVEVYAADGERLNPEEVFK